MKTFFGKLWSALNIKNNFGLKVLSLVLAIFFWIFVMDKENPIVTRTFYNVPIVYAGETDPGLVVSSAPTYYSNIEISGRRNSVLATRSDSFVLKVNLPGLKDGKNEAEIEYSTLLNDINIDRVSPSSVVVVLEKVISVEKPVYYNKKSSFEESLSKSVLYIEPSAVMVTGPRSLVADVSSVIGTIDVSAVTGSTSMEVSLVPVNSLGEKVDDVILEKDVATVTVKAMREKRVPFTYEYRDETDENHKVTRFIVSTNMVTIIGDPSIVDRVASIKANPIVVTGPEDSEGVVTFEAVDGVTITDADQVTYEAQYVESLENNLVFRGSDLVFENVDANYRATVEENTEITIKVKGTKETVEKIKNADFVISLDLSGLGEGEHEISPQVKFLSQANVVYEVLNEAPVKVIITKKAEE